MAPPYLSTPCNRTSRPPLKPALCGGAPLSWHSSGKGAAFFRVLLSTGIQSKTSHRCVATHLARYESGELAQPRPPPAANPLCRQAVCLPCLASPFFKKRKKTKRKKKPSGRPFLEVHQKRERWNTFFAACLRKLSLEDLRKK